MRSGPVNPARPPAATIPPLPHAYVLRRSRWRRGSIDNFGDFQIIDPFCNFIRAGDRFDMTLADVERWLAE